MHRFLKLTVLLLVPSLLNGYVTRIDSFTEALEKARSTQQPLLALIHGSSWHPASKRLNEEVWQDLRFTQLIEKPLIITAIEVSQNVDKDTAEREKAARKGWKSDPVKTYPAVQIYAQDGHVLTTVQGRSLIGSTSAVGLASRLNPIIKAAYMRDQLLQQYNSDMASGKEREALDALIQLNELPINKEANIIELLTAADPNDNSGWQARLQFKGWGYMREMTGKLNDGRAEEALIETEAALSSKAYSPEQRILILGAKGRALVALGQYDDAWHCFQDAAQFAPNSAEAKAILSYGRRVAGAATREIIDATSPLANSGANLTKQRANYTLSSQAHDDGSRHHMLFQGPLPSGSAFHTDNEKGAHIIIDLDGLCEVRALNIVNRSNIHERAAGLTVWASTNKREWEEIWQADSVQGSWQIRLQRPVRASHLKVGLPEDTKNFLHLRAVDAYGKRL